MRFFKHFTDAHRGQSLQKLKRVYGYEIIGRYWDLVEICAEKLTKERDEVYTDDHCVFSFDVRYLAATLQTHQASRLLMYLSWLADVQLMSFSCTGDVVSIHMPKLLECIDRDAKKVRTGRAKEIDKEIDIDIKEHSEPPTADTPIGTRSRGPVFDFESVYKTYPLKKGKDRGFKQLAKMIRTPLDFDDFVKAVNNYTSEVIRDQVEPKFIKHFSSFVGTEKGQPWRDYVSIEDLPHSKPKNPHAGAHAAYKKLLLVGNHES